MLLPALLLTSGLLLPAPAVDRLAEARAALAEGDKATAEELLSAIATDDADALEARILLADLLLERRRPEARRVVELLDPWSDSTDARALTRLGLAYEAIARELQSQGGSIDDVGYFLGEALAHLELAAQHAPPELVQPTLKAGYLALYDFGDWRKALDLADAALEHRPQDPELRLLRGCARLYEYVDAKTSGDEQAVEAAWAGAVEDLEFAGLALGEQRGDAWWQLAWLYEDKGEAEAAVEAAVRHMQRTPDMDISRVYGLAKRYANENRFDASLQALEALVARDPAELTRWVSAEDDPTATAVRLGYSIGGSVARGDLDQALRVLEPLTAVDPAHADFWNNYGLICRDAGVLAERAGKAERAAELYRSSYEAYEKALTYDPENPQFLNDTALVMHYHVRTDLERAKELYRAAIEHAQARIDAGDELPELKIALRDARNNLALLER